MGVNYYFNVKIVLQMVNIVTHERYLNFLKLLPSFDYSWQEADCYQFANYLRKFFYLDDLPNVSKFYLTYKETDLTNTDCLTDFETILKTNTEIVNFADIQDFDLVYMKFNKLPCLGTYLNQDIFYLGNFGAVFKAPDKLSSKIISFHRLSVD